METDSNQRLGVQQMLSLEQIAPRLEALAKGRSIVCGAAVQGVALATRF